MMPRIEKYEFQRVRPGRRRGMNVVAALACLTIVTAILGSMLQSVVRARHQLTVERDRRQAELLLQAGADRAFERLATEPEFRGDTWELSADSILGQGAGRVTTEVSAAANGQSRQLRVVAEYPLGSRLTITRSHTFSITSDIP